MRLAQIRVIVAQSKIVESRWPIGEERHKKEYRGEQPGAHARSAAAIDRHAGMRNRNRDRALYNIFGQGHNTPDAMMLQRTPTRRP